MRDRPVSVSGGSCKTSRPVAWGGGRVTCRTDASGRISIFPQGSPTNSTHLHRATVAQPAHSPLEAVLGRTAGGQNLGISLPGSSSSRRWKRKFAWFWAVRQVLFCGCFSVVFVVVGHLYALHTYRHKCVEWQMRHGKTQEALDSVEYFETSGTKAAYFCLLEVLFCPECPTAPPDSPL